MIRYIIFLYSFVWIVCHVSPHGPAREPYDPLMLGAGRGRVPLREGGDVAYIILPWFGSQIFKKLPGVSGSIRPKPVLIKSLRLDRSWGQKASLLLRIMECPSLQQCRKFCLLEFPFYNLTKGNAIILLIITIILLVKDDECFPGEEYCLTTLMLNSQSSELCFLKLRNLKLNYFLVCTFAISL